MSLHSRLNQYNGINAHLHSALQSEPGGWESFHGVHITHLAETLDRILPDGYEVSPERSMQIRLTDPESPDQPALSRRPRPDVSIQAGESAAAYHESAEATEPARIYPATESLDLDVSQYLRRLEIRRVEVDGHLQTVTWIELLSPTNKVPNRGALAYREKRNLAIRGKLALVELDYLHETHPPIPHIADYRQREDGATPYSIVITVPRPALDRGSMQIYDIRVEQSLPVIAVPLSGDDRVLLDLQVVYNHSFSSMETFSRRVDYEQLPDRFDRYDETDQGRIRARMQTVQAAQAQGDDLSQPPLPLLDSAQ